MSDSGIGIAPAVQSNIFKVFEQADASTTRRFGGTGLGLAICQKLLKIMGSSIELRSEVGKGSTFSFVLRLPLNEDERMESEGKVRQVAVANTGRIKVLVVEDNALSREITVHRLKKMNLEVFCATNGIEAIEMFQSETFNLVLMDCQMPDMDGFEATARIRELENGRRRCPIVALTAHAMDGYKEVCLGAGMDDYLTKPIKEKELDGFLNTLHLR